MMSESTKLPLLRSPKTARRSLQFAVFLFPAWGISWFISWAVIQQITINGPIISVLFAKNILGFGLAVIPIILGIQGISELKKYPGYSTGYLRAALGISIGAGFFIVEIVTFFLIIALMIQKEGVT